MNSYQNYKDSGIEWVGKIPDHWGIKKVSHTAYIKSGTKYDDFIKEGPYSITGTDFNKDGSLNWDNMRRISQKNYDKHPYVKIQKDDVLITKDGTIGKIGYVDELKGPTCLNSGVFVTRPLSNSYIPRFFFWVLNSKIFNIFTELNSYGSTIKHLYKNTFNDFIYTVPPHNEQTKIAKYLDYKTSLIDKVIKKNEKLIQLLEEKRIATINQAVTKGLNPDVKMKDTGIEWLGEIPEHWEMKPLKYFGEIVTGTTPSTQNVQYYENGIYPFVTPTDINQRRGISKTERYLTNEGIRKGRFIPKGSLLVTCVASIGKNAILDSDGSCNQQINAILPNKNYSAIYLYYLMENNSSFLTNFADKSATSIINKRSFSNLEFVIPPLSEQLKIAEYLDKKTKQIDKLIKEKKKTNNYLEQYRTTLISDVVTGKIDIRDETIPENKD